MKKQNQLFALIFLIALSGTYLWQNSNGYDPDQTAQTAANLEEKLESLPYATEVKVSPSDLNKKNVTLYNVALSYPGLNFYCPENEGIAYVTDMNGRVLRSYSDPRFKRCFLFQPYGNDAGLIAIEGAGLFLTNLSSGEIQMYPGSFHHSLHLSEQGDIYTLTKYSAFVPQINRTNKIQDDCLEILSPNLTLKKKICFAKLIVNDQHLLNLTLNSLKNNPSNNPTLDVFHMNQAEPIPRDVYINGIRIFKKGDVLFSMRNLNIIGALDVETEEIYWYWGEGVLEHQHTPTLQDNGNILIFNNGIYRRYSSIIEINPLTGETMWEYGKNSREFYSSTRGSAERLPNGNILVTESVKGHVFEISPAGEMVWEFWNPVVKKDSMRGSIFRMIRIDANATNL